MASSGWTSDISCGPLQECFGFVWVSQPDTFLTGFCTNNASGNMLLTDMYPSVDPFGHNTFVCYYYNNDPFASHDFQVKGTYYNPTTNGTNAVPAVGFGSSTSAKGAVRLPRR